LFSKDGKQLPFDVGSLRAIPYELHADGTPTNIDTTGAALVQSLMEARKATTEGPIPDSPVFQLVEGYPSDIAHAKTDVFRERVQYTAEPKKALATARQQGVEALRTCERQLGSLAEVEAGVVIDLFLSYRAVRAWEEDDRPGGQMPRPLADWHGAGAIRPDAEPRWTWGGSRAGADGSDCPARSEQRNAAFSGASTRRHWNTGARGSGIAMQTLSRATA
jgi:hypothetical protein